MAGRSIHVRLDEASLAALRVVRADAASESDAVRTALREAAERRRRRSSLEREVAAIMADEADRAEMQQVRAHMDELAPDWPEEV